MEWGRQGSLNIAQGTQISLHEHGNCLRQGCGCIGEEEGQEHGVQGKWHEMVEQRPFTGAGMTSHHNPDLVSTTNTEYNSSVAFGPFSKGWPDNSQVRALLCGCCHVWMNHCVIFLYLSFRWQGSERSFLAFLQCVELSRKTDMKSTKRRPEILLPHSENDHRNGL